MECLKLPTLYCPFLPATNRHAALVDQRTRTWAQQWQLIVSDADMRRLHAMELGWLAARTHPDATLPALQLVTDWCVWLFIHDDVCDEVGLGHHPGQLAVLHTDFLAILTGDCTRTQPEPLAAALSDLWQRTAAIASPSWIRRFTRNMEDFLQAGVWEATNRSLGQRPNLETYLQMRPFTSGMYTYINLIEVIDGITLPSAVHDHVAVQRLVRLATNAACWVNDILSVAKELKQGDVHNLVLALQHRHRLTLQEALDRAGAIHDMEVRAFIDAVSGMPVFGESADALLRQYVGVLRSYMRGNLDWSYRTGRYALAEIALGA